MRGMVPLEILAVLVVACVPLPEAMPAALPLFVAASLARYYRRRSWAELFSRTHARGGDLAIGALAGALALVLALVAGTPVIEAMSHRAVEWSTFPVVRGSSVQLVVVAMVVGLSAVAAELALRGWLVERVLEVSPGGAMLPVMLGAVAEALITRGDFAARLGAGMFGLGLGWMYVASGRRIVASLTARVVFQLGAVLLEALRVIG